MKEKRTKHTYTVSKNESRWVCVTKSLNPCMNSSMLLKMKKNEMEGKYPFEYDIFTFNVWEIRKVLSIITLPQFPMSFAIIVLEYVRLSGGLTLAAAAAFFFSLY